MGIKSIIIVGIISFFFSIPAVAQTKNGIKDSASLQVRFGPYRDGMTALSEDLRRLAGAELIITDSSGVKWKLIEYRVGWRRKEESIDIKTGVRKSIFTYSAERVEDSTHLPVIWQNLLKENLQSGESLLFEEILVKHPKAGSIRRAKPLTIKVL